jgi:hypothetical protein
VSKEERHTKDSICRNKKFMISQGSIRIDGIRSNEIHGDYSGGRSMACGSEAAFKKFSPACRDKWRFLIIQLFINFLISHTQ